MTRSVPTLAELDDYVSGALAEADADPFEAALFEAAMRGEDAARPYLALREGLLALCRRGTFGVVLTEVDARRVQQSGLKVAYYDVDGAVPARLSRSADVLLMKFALDLRGVTRLDVEMLAGGQLLKTVEDVPFEPGAAAVYMACEAELALEAARAQAGQRFVAVDGGSRRVLREYQVRDGEVVLED